MQKSGSFSSSIRRVVLGMALLCSFVAAVAGLYFSFSTPTPVAATKSPQRSAEAHSVDDGYVGSQRCAECHQEIATRYQTHSMAHSFNSVEAAEPIEQLENAVVRPPGLRHYVVEKTSEGCWHHEIAADEDGQTIYSQRVPISFALGSGQRGRTYLLDRDGLLFQSPIGWYSQEQKWDLSPGYDPAKHQRFSRRIGNGCLFCHVGRVNETTRGSDRYQKPPFLESSIGCERCHGPGQRHIQRHENGLVDARIEETIVNPAKLDPERREAVCNQCHLQGTRVVLRRDRSFWDFRPGQMVDDVWLVFLLKSRTDETGSAQAVSQVEQMYESKCYLESRQKLGCISCHDPHGLPPESRRDTYYRLRCFECHNDQSCSLPIEKQDAAPAAGSCIACHMPRLDTQDVPHTAQTDHRVLRSYSPVNKPTPADSDNSNAMKLFGNAELRVPKTEIDRGKGLLMAEFARARGDKKLAEAARKVLLPDAGEQLVPETLNGLGDDLDVLEALGGMYDVAGQPYSAVSCWEQVLRFDPEKESVLASLADLCLRHGNLEGAERYLVRLLKINPYLPEAHFRLADLLFYKGDIQEAIRLGERSLELDPNDVRLREWLAKVYLGARMPEKNRAQVDILNRIDKASANTKKK